MTLPFAGSTRVSLPMHSMSQPPESIASPPSRQPPPAEALAALEDTVRRLRAELAAATGKARQSRLLTEIADLEERRGDEPAAARDYLAAYNGDSSFREPLEGLVRLLEKRRSLKNLGKLVDALVRASGTPEERSRALRMRAAYQADVSHDLSEAKAAAREATEVAGAPAVDASSAWLALEVLAGRTGDTAARAEALSRRASLAAQPWSGARSCKSTARAWPPRRAASRKRWRCCARRSASAPPPRGRPRRRSSA